MRLELRRVQFIPKVLEPGILYVAEELGAAAHLCACGCGTKVRTPLSPVDWALSVTPWGPTLYPSIGNWQQPCQSHYWIRNGEVRWAERWGAEEIAAGRERDEGRARQYFEGRARRARNRVLGELLGRGVRWVARIFGGTDPSAPGVENGEGTQRS